MGIGLGVGLVYGDRTYSLFSKKKKIIMTKNKSLIFIKVEL